MGKKIPGRPKKVKGAARRAVLKRRGKASRKAKKRPPIAAKKKRAAKVAARPAVKKVAARRAVKKKKRAVQKVAARPAVKKKRPPIVAKKKKRAKVAARPAAKKKKRKKRAVKRRPIRSQVIPKGWRKVQPVVYTPHDLERMAAQIAQRIGEKIVGGGHAPDSIEAQILMNLISAEQQGTLNREFYQQSGIYDGYDTPQEVYQLWIYSGG